MVMLGEVFTGYDKNSIDVLSDNNHDTNDVIRSFKEDTPMSLALKKKHLLLLFRNFIHIVNVF